MAQVNVAPRIQVEPPTTEADKAWQADYDKDVQAQMADVLKDLGVEADADADSELSPEELVAADALAEDVMGHGLGDPADHLPKVDEDREPMPDPLAPVEQKAAPAPKAPAPKQPEEKTPERVSTAMLRLMDKEREVTEARETLRREREEFESRRGQASENAVDIDTLRRAMRNDPVGVFRAMGLDPQDAMPVLVAAQLGDKAPPEIRAAAERAAERAEREELRNQIQNRDRVEAARAEYTRVAEAARTFVTSGAPSLARAPTMAEIAKGDPDLAHELLMEEIVRDAQRRARTEPNGRPMAHEDAALAAEKRLARLAKIFRAQQTQTPAAPQERAASGAPEQKAPGVAPKKLASKPRPPGKTWVDEQRENEVEAALREARALERRLRSRGL